jgi:ABC-type multidrug transport system ATPase subunit
LIDNLDRALEERWVKVFYQPIVRAANGRVCDEEGLARWMDPERGPLAPSAFIPVLEEAQLIYKLDLYMVDRILEKLRDQAAAGLYLVPQSVNLSRSDFDACDMVEEIRRRVDEALEIVGMTKYKNHAPHLLSGGQKQRIAIAGVIAMRPKCIVLDEPTAMLDPRGRREVMETIRRLNRESKITVVLITHHMSEAAMADRVLVMDHGNILADGTPKEVFSQVEKLKEANLTVPETTALLYELNQNGFDFSLDALSVEECAQAIYKTFA